MNNLDLHFNFTHITSKDYIRGIDSDQINLENGDWCFLGSTEYMH